MTTVTAGVHNRTTLGLRITLLCLMVAGVVALVAGVISIRLVTTTARDVTRQSLSDQADVVAAQLAEAGPGGRIGARRVINVLRGQGISVVRLQANGDLVPGEGPATSAARLAGLETVTADVPLHETVAVERKLLLVEGRAVGDGSSVALVREVAMAKEAGRRLVGNVVLALAVGLLVASVAGLVLARRVSKPLRQTAGVAVSMGHGRRDLRAPVEGPREVAGVAESVNGLADALQRSESRQRDFLLSVSHELRTPLTAVKGFAESLADEVVTGESVPPVGRTIEREASRLERLVDDLLDLARIGADDFRLDMATVDLTELVTDAGRVWQRRCEAEGVRFELTVPSGSVPVRTDPRRLRQVIDGLAENALRMTPEGEPIVLSLSVASGAAVLQLRDGGPGLSEEDYRVAFERGVLHVRYAGVRPVGTGLGLALVHGLVTRLGGTIHAGPAPEGGACFTVLLR